MILPIFLILMLFVLSFLISGTETAYFSLRKKDILFLKKESDFLIKIFHHPERFIVIIIVLINLTHSFASSIFTEIFCNFFPRREIILNDILITVFFSIILFIFAELLPKNIAFLSPERFASFITPLFKFLYIFFEKLLFPVIFLFSLLRKLMFKRKKYEGFIEELNKSLSIIEKMGEIEREEKILIENIIKARKIHAKEIMVPYEKMKSFPPDKKIKEILKEEIVYSHIPVIHQDKIMGVVKIWEIFKEENNERHIYEILSPCSFYDENIVIADLFLKMVKEKEEFVILKRGEDISGCVTIRDISNFFLKDIQ
ncbi:MAG: CNNM domain-containing protein [candidate division WOR-3 bacterium]